MKKLTLLIAFIFTHLLFSQSTFEKGYFIMSNGEKVDCLIKNKELNSSPEIIKYKLSKEDDVNTIETSKISEFTIYDLVKFKSINSKMDNSDTNDINLVPKTIFAQIIVEGEATLYSYRDNDGLHYFYNVGNSEINELIQKEYIENGITKYNNDYLVKLNTDVRCTETTDFTRVKLNEKELKKYFINYNSCKNSELKFVKASNKIKLGLNVFAGINSSRLTLNKVIPNQFLDDLKFENKISPTFGIEGEAYLPINNYKFSIISGVTYRSYDSSIKSEDADENFEIQYTSLELNLGVRHYMYLNEKSKLFVEANVVKDFLINEKSVLEFDPVSGIQNTGDADNILNPEANISFGFGYIYNNFGIKFKYFTSREMFTPVVYASKFDNIALHLTYKVL